MTPPNEDGARPTAITYKHWMETLTVMAEHPSCGANERKLATMLKTLFEINRFDPETIAYMNARAFEAMEAADQ